MLVSKIIRELLSMVILPSKKFLVFLTVLFLIYAIPLGLAIYKNSEDRIKPLSISNIVEYLIQNLHDDEVVFAFDRSALYGQVQNAKINFYLNDSTIAYFDIPTAKELYKALQRNNVKYIFIASYRPFILNTSAFSELLVNPDYTEIVVIEQNYTLYKLNSNLQNNRTKKLKISVSPENQYNYVNLKQNTEYIIDITQLSKEQNTFYTLTATSNEYSYAYFTHNGSTKFRIKTPILEKRDEDVVLALSITAKDKLLKLKIDISDFDRPYSEGD
ncbi:MAG: hypothetical protein LN588_04550 [Rickettsia endosymbiont of Bryobia graminum]|nr:hypothetical protein [Rickettsia endosymbiont of Bryobia graminum]